MWRYCSLVSVSISCFLKTDSAQGLPVPALLLPEDDEEATQAGVILGTAAYMSPEQARGLATDGRTDIWAFGAVLFEMLSGRSPFGGEDLTLTLAAVAKEEPDWTLLPTEARPLRQPLARCLTKDPRQRFHHIADVRIAIEDCLDAPPSADEDAVSTRRTAVTGVRTLSLAAAVAARAVWLRPLHSVTARRLEATTNTAGLFWSPDSRSIGFFGDGQLKKIDVSGEAVETLGPSVAVGTRRSGAWRNESG